VLLKDHQLGARHGTLTVTQTNAAQAVMLPALAERRPRVHGGQQSNSSATFDETLILKLFRRVTAGVNPEVEIGRHLTDQASVPQVPRMAAALEYRGPQNERVTIAVGHEYVRHQQDAWTHALDELGRYFERVEAEFAAGPAQQAELLHELEEPQQIAAAAWSRPSVLAQNLVGDYLEQAELLGQRTAELHIALCQPTSDAAFTPEPFTRLYQRSLYQGLRTHVRTTLAKLLAHAPKLDPPARELAAEVVAAENAILQWFARLSTELIDAQRLRCHGDFHLGQVLFTGKDFLIIDFEGEPERPISERRIKTTPLRDVAGMLRSLHYVAHAALEGQAPGLAAPRATGQQYEQWANYWYRAASAAFLRGYLHTARPAGFLPHNEDHLTVLLNAYLMDKALYELKYEMNNRPGWLVIPLQGVLDLVSHIETTAPK
jgi:maltose alpha-D-glucosyltransferase/alpha-amylase